jgi:hypothetical protein
VIDLAPGAAANHALDASVHHNAILTGMPLISDTTAIVTLNRRARVVR